jgi:RNA polymerase sigma-70 factor (ECF subfamily)
MAHEMTQPPAAAGLAGRATALPAAARGGRVQAAPGRVRLRPDAFERLFEDHAERLFSFLAYRTGDRALAEDLLSETFERALRSRRPFDPRRGSGRRWLYTIALNLLRDHARRATHEHRVIRDLGAGTPAAERDAALAAVEQRDELQRALAELSEAEREALALRFGGDLTVREVARVLGEGESAVEGRIYRALGRLREQLA